MLFRCSYRSPLGEMLLLCDEASLSGLWFKGQKYEGGRDAAALSALPQIDPNAHPVLSETTNWLERYFNGERPSPFALSLAPSGTPFQRAIWALLCEIPYGKTVTYGDLAQSYAAQNGLRSMSAQAVGSAVGHNPISIIIPCHRVVGANGALTGYAGGIDKKRRLLELEGVPQPK